VYAAATAEMADLTPRFDGRVNVGALSFLCSTRHYELFNAFLAAGARMRNGRPSKMIRSVLDQDQSLRQSLTVEALNDEGSIASFVSPGRANGETSKRDGQSRRGACSFDSNCPSPVTNVLKSLRSGGGMLMESLCGNYASARS
jgi:hypothetical protein